MSVVNLVNGKTNSKFANKIDLSDNMGNKKNSATYSNYVKTPVTNYTSILSGKNNTGKSSFANKIDLASNIGSNNNVTYSNLQKNPVVTSVVNTSGTSSQNDVQVPQASLPSVQNDLQSGQNDLSAALREQQQYYADQLRSQQQAQQQAAQNAYNQNMSALQDAYQKKLAGLESNFGATKSQLTDSYNSSVKELNDSATKALQEAYISKMMSEKNLPNQLSIQGLNGGATESAMASLMNNYGNARNNIATAQQNSLSQLEQAYNSNMANALQKYNDARNSAADNNFAYRMQLENDLANNTINSYADLYSALANMDGNYTNAMSSYIANQAERSADLQYALQKQILNNQLSKSSGSSSSSSSGSTVNSDTVSRIKQLMNNGKSRDDVIYQLIDEGYSNTEIEQFLNAVGIY